MQLRVPGVGCRETLPPPKVGKMGSDRSRSMSMCRSVPSLTASQAASQSSNTCSQNTPTQQLPACLATWLGRAERSCLANVPHLVPWCARWQLPANAAPMKASPAAQQCPAPLLAVCLGPAWLASSSLAAALQVVRPPTRCRHRCRLGSTARTCSAITVGCSKVAGSKTNVLGWAGGCTCHTQLAVSGGIPERAMNKGARCCRVAK